jgi:hypothetical protein
VRGKASIALLVAASCAVLALPAGAAAVKTHHHPAQVVATIEAHGTHGFEFLVFALDRAVILATSKTSFQGGQSVSYIATPKHAPAGLDHGRLDLKFGKLGHFRGHFVPTSTKVGKPEGGCTGEPTIEEDGYFVGSFAFHGERGYTTLKASREPGEITHMGATDCRVPTESESHRHKGKAVEEQVEKAAEEDQFRLLAGDAKGNLILQASREQVPPGRGGGATTSLEVTAAGGRAGAFRISRSVSILESKDAASTLLTPNLAEPLAEATLAPPAPFSGSATFHLEGPKAASWTGDLAVELPGLGGDVPLTGKQIYAGACRGWTNCTKTLPERLQTLLEVGAGLDASFYVGAEVQTIS